MHRYQRIIRGAISVATAGVLALALSGSPAMAAQSATTQPAAHIEQSASLEAASSHTLTRPTLAATATYRVRSGDTLGAIARRFCGSFTAYHALAAASGIANPDRIFPGQTIKLACSAKSTTRPKAPTTSRSSTRSATFVAPLAHWTLSCSNSFHSKARPGHNGLDLMSPTGRPIYAVAAGTMVAKAYEAGGGGNYIAISHGTFKTIYMHMRVPSRLNIGQHVSAGQVIGYVGMTGDATAPHVHFEVHRALWSQRIDPAPWLRARGIAVGC